MSKLGVIEQFTKEMKSSGYDRRGAREAVISGIKGDRKRHERKEKDGGSFYKTAEETLKDRINRKLLESTTWYKDPEETQGKEKDEFHQESWEAGENLRKGKIGEKPGKNRVKGGKIQKRKGKGKSSSAKGKSNIKSVLFVPFTQGSKLAKKMRDSELKLEEMTGYRLKIVERGGTKLEDILIKKNLWAGDCCDREACLLCSTKMKDDKIHQKSCTKRNLVYKTWCHTCHSRNMENLRKEAGNPKLEEVRKYMQISL